MKKKSYAAVVAGAFLLLSGAQVCAAPPGAELEVKGKLATPGCIVSAGDRNDGTYDYHSLSSTLIKPGKDKINLDKQSQTWTVSCDADTLLTFDVSDQRAASRSEIADTKFGLGNVNETGKLGFYTVTMRNAKVDGIDRLVAAALYTHPLDFGAFSSRELSRVEWIGWGLRTYVLAPGKVFSADLEVAPTLAGTTDMNGPITDTVPLDGLLTLSFQFGIK